MADSHPSGGLAALAVQSASETLDDGERTYLQDENAQLIQEIDRISAVTEFNGLSLTDGTITTGTIGVQVGINNTTDDQIDITLGDLRATTGLGVGAVDVSSSTTAGAALSVIDAALDTVNGIRSDYGAVQNRLESAMRNLENYDQNLTSAESQIRDADFAKESAEMAKFQVMQQAGVAALSQAKSINMQAAQLIQ